MLTVEIVEKALPSNLRSAATQSLVDMINNISQDPLIAEQIRENFISYTGVLRDGKYKTEDYLNAVTYVSFKLMGHSNQDAYFKTFPGRHAALIAKQTSSKDIAAYVAAYARGKLVNAILERSLVPTWVLNQDLYQKALNVQADLMINANSEKVRSDAANSLLTHLTKPKEAGPLVNIDMRETTGMGELKNLLAKLATEQRQAIESGVPARQIAAQRLVDAPIPDAEFSEVGK
jgi:hypothetical protein